MSYKITNEIRSLDLPPTAKFVLWVMSDIADDHGRCYPSISRLMAETGYSNRAIINAIHLLESYKIIECDRLNGRHTRYQITPENYVKPAEESTKKQTKPAHHVHQCATFTSEPSAYTSEPSAGVPVNLIPKPVNQVHTNHQEPSYEPSRNHQSIPAKNPDPVIEPTPPTEPPKKSKTRAPKKTTLPDGFDQAVSDEVLAWAAKHGHTRLTEHLASFCDKARSRGYTYADWNAAFKTAIRENWGKIGQSTGKPIGKFDPFAELAKLAQPSHEKPEEMRDVTPTFRGIGVIGHA